MTMVPTLSPLQYRTLVAIRDSLPHTLWPMMRRGFVRAGLIVAAGPSPEPVDKRRPQAPTRPFSVTKLGHDAIAAHGDEEPAKPCGRGPMRMELERAP